MSRLDFITSLGLPPTYGRIVWHGTERDLLEARKARCMHTFHVLLTKAGTVNDEETRDHLWVDAQVLVSQGRDLH